MACFAVSDLEAFQQRSTDEGSRWIFRLLLSECSLTRQLFPYWSSCGTEFWDALFQVKSDKFPKGLLCISVSPCFHPICQLGFLSHLPLIFLPSAFQFLLSGSCFSRYSLSAFVPVSPCFSSKLEVIRNCIGSLGFSPAMFFFSFEGHSLPTSRLFNPLCTFHHPPPSLAYKFYFPHLIL